MHHPNLGVYHANFPNLKRPRAPSKNIKKFPDLEIYIVFSILSSNEILFNHVISSLIYKCFNIPVGIFLIYLLQQRAVPSMNWMFDCKQIIPLDDQKIGTIKIVHFLDNDAHHQ